MKGAQQLLQATYKAALASSRQYASSAGVEGRKVAVLGAAGGIGQPLSLLMKVRKPLTHLRDQIAASYRAQLSPHVSELALYDIAGTPGVAADVSHVNQPAIVKVCQRSPSN